MSTLRKRGPTKVGPGNPPSGIGGVHGNVTQLGQLVAMLSPKFLPASLVDPPGSTGSGGRATALTTKSEVVNSVNGQSGHVNLTTPPIQVAVMALSGGTLTWNFTTAFDNPPVVFAFPIVVPSTAGTTLYCPSPGPNETSVIVTSTDSGDHRTLMLLAVGNPS